MLTLRKGGHRDLERYYGLMEVDFDSEELIGKLAIHRALSRGDQELLIAYDDETGLEGAYALVCCRGLYGYVLLKYLGVFPWYRGKGLGKVLLNKAKEIARETDCEQIELKCAHWNKASAEFYKAQKMKNENEWITFTLDKSQF